MDRAKIEEQMASDAELSQYLRKLEGGEKDDAVQEERDRRRAARESKVTADVEAMDTEETSVSHVI